MKIATGKAGVAVAAASGAVFGAATSLANALSSPYSRLGAPLTGTVPGRTAKVLSLLLDAGWSWAVLAVLAGAVAGAAAGLGVAGSVRGAGAGLGAAGPVPGAGTVAGAGLGIAGLVRGAAAGVVSLAVASTAYYAMDTVVFDGGTDTLLWVVVSVPFGSVLGAIGAAARRPGAVGLLAALTVPAGAAAQMLLIPPRPHLTVTASIVVAETVVWTGAALGTALAVRRFLLQRRTSRTTTPADATALPTP
ncbi:hypothetical protein RM863_02560 [Streptomyces sp. DSM 41014]|uniref:ABC transporter permease n=1 Tax=Streptomyces hintoniae TaxID=3075521 RepID=A0ABU2UCN6_9ACTN|nr:hypothetical protein [Streptomyces sp. DSM 41014]MDT0471022.1 hypothetical protein [Streptomyces sp. DSM 41014]